MEELIKKETSGRWKTIYFENKAGEVVSKRCTKCEEIKQLDEYYTLKTGIGGRMASCKDCYAKYREDNRERRREVGREYYRQNKEIVKERHRKYCKRNRAKVTSFCRKWRRENRDRDLENARKWREVNREYVKLWQREWAKKNPHKIAKYDQTRKARKLALPYTLTDEQYQKTLEYFNYSCALTGGSERIEMDHAIPLASGFGGTTFENCYPLSKSLNSSKNDKNIFEWFDLNKERLNIEQWRFDRLVEYLAGINSMSVSEYKKYYFGCFEKPKGGDLSAEA